MGDGRLVFRNTFEALYRQLGPSLTESQREEIRRLGVDFGRDLEPAYPAEVFFALIDALARMVYPELTPQEALRRIGRAGVEGYTRTMLGLAVRAGAVLMGPRRTLERTERNLRTSDNFVGVEVVTTGERSVRIRLDDVGSRISFFRGMFEAIVEISGGVSPLVMLTAIDPPAAEFAISWAAEAGIEAKAG